MQRWRYVHLLTKIKVGADHLCRHIGAYQWCFMRVSVETWIGDRGLHMPRRVYIESRPIEVLETFDQWHDNGHSYCTVKCRDGNLYRLCCNESSAEWELTQIRPGPQCID